MIGRREFITRKPFSAARCSLTHLVTSASTLNSGMSISPRLRRLLQHR